MNPIQEKIYKAIIEDMVEMKREYSYLTNTELSSKIGRSAFSVRDHVTKLVKKGYLQKVVNYWDDRDQFHNRVLYKGSKKME